MPVDFFKSRCLLENDEILQNPNLDFHSDLNENTGENSDIKIAILDHIQITYYPPNKQSNKPRLKVQGSLHKYYNRTLSKENINRYLLKGFNGNDFTFLQVAQSIAHLCNRLNIKSHKMKLTNLEIGVNFIPPVDTIQILDGLILHQGKEFSKPESYQYRQVVHSQFYIKVYNKAKQYNLLNQLCRYELKFVKMVSLNSIGITTLADLTEKAVYKRFESIFLAAWSKTLFFDYTINKDDLREKQISQIKDYSNPIYWLKLSSKHRDRPKKELQKITEIYSDNIQAKALEIIELKWDELLVV